MQPEINEVKVTAVNDIEPTTTAENNQQMSMPNTNIRGQIVDPSVQAMAIPYPANRISTNQLINFPFPAFPNGPASPLSGGVTSVNRNQNTANSGDLDIERKKGQQNRGVAGVGDNSNKETNTAQDNTDKTADKETSNPIAYLSKNYTSDIADGKTDSCASPKSDVTGESILTSYVRFAPGGGVPGFCMGCREMKDFLPVVGLLPSFNSEFASLPTFNTISSQSGPQAMPCLSGFGYCSKCNEEFDSNIFDSQLFSMYNPNSNSTQIAGILTTDVRQGMIKSVEKYRKEKENNSTSQSLNLSHPLSMSNIQCLQQYLHKSNSAPAVNQAAAYGQQTQQWQQQLNVQPPQQMQPLPLPQQIQSPPPQQQMQFGQLQQKPEFLAFNDYGQPVGFESCPVPTQIPLSQDQPQNIPSDDVQLNNMNKVQTRILYTRDTEFNISGGSVTNSADSEIDNTKASLSTKQTQTEQRNREEEMSNGCEPSGAASFLPSSTDSNGASFSYSDSASGGATGFEHHTNSDDREVWDLSKTVFTTIQEALDFDSVHNWRDLADIHGWNYGDIHRLEQKWAQGQQIRSPFIYLLEHFKCYTIRNLKDDLRKMQRKDVLIKLERFENNNELFSGRFS